MDISDEYEIVEKISEGGEGEVFLARYIRTGRMFAMKVQTGDIRNIKNEAKILGAINDRRIPYLIDFAHYEDKDILIMEYVKGMTLKQYVEENKPDAEGAFKLFLKITELFSFLHSGSPGMIYRDIKPENIMITDDSDIKLVDMGAAVMSYGDAFVESGAGSRGYAAPECMNEKRIDASADVYSLGVLLCFMLTGNDPSKPPFAPDVEGAIAACTNEAKRHMIKKCLSTDPSKRYSDASGLLSALKDAENKEYRKSVAEIFEDIRTFLSAFLSVDAVMFILEQTESRVSLLPEYLSVFYKGNTGKTHILILALLMILILMSDAVSEHIGERRNFIISRDINILFTEK